MQTAREFWNRRYGERDYLYGKEVNDFLASHPDLFVPGAKVLCLAEGEGRNAVWVALRGCDVTAVDISYVGLAKAEKLASKAGVSITTLVRDLADFDPGTGTWDAIVSIFAHVPAPVRRALHARIRAALKPGGVLIFEGYAPQQIDHDTGGPKQVEMLVAATELQQDFKGLQFEHLFEGVRPVIEGHLHTGDGHVTQAVIRNCPA